MKSENTLYFSTLGESTDRYTFHFEYAAEFSGSLDSSWVPGLTLATGDGKSVSGLAESTLSGNSNEFVVDSDYFRLNYFNDSHSLLSFSESATGSFAVSFDTGDSNLSITFATDMVVNAGVSVIPEPTPSGFIALGILVWISRSRRNAGYHVSRA